MRLYWLTVLLACSAAVDLSLAERLKPFPWINRSDPKIQTQIFVRSSTIEVAARRVGVLRFAVSQQNEPEAPAFEDFLHQALLQDGSVEASRCFPAPWDTLPPWEPRPLTAAARIRAAAEAGRSQGLDLVVLGSLDSLFRTAGGGLIVKATAWLISTSDHRVVWYGRKRASWLRRFSTEDCLLHLGQSFVAEWRSPAGS